MTPDEIHALGLAEVARLEGEMDAVLKSVGETNGPLVERMERLSRDPRFTFSNDDAGREKILAGYRTLLEAMQKRLPEAFANIPPQKLEVERVPTYAEATSAGAYYNAAVVRRRASPASSSQTCATRPRPRPGRCARSPITKAIPGPSLPDRDSRRNIEGVAFFAPRAAVHRVQRRLGALRRTSRAETWASTTTTRIGDLGRLQAEMFRAVRLVVDTGIHAQALDARSRRSTTWTRTPACRVTEVMSEIERYIVMPGQACAYKIGMLEILELRERAKQALGAKLRPARSSTTSVLGQRRAAAHDPRTTHRRLDR